MSLCPSVSLSLSQFLLIADSTRSSPEALTPLFHFINTKDPSRADINSAGDVPVSKLLQCPCVNQFLNTTDGTVDGWEPYPPFGTCSPGKH